MENCGKKAWRATPCHPIDRVDGSNCGNGNKMRQCKEYSKETLC